jgi:hypothetical protein
MIRCNEATLKLAEMQDLREYEAIYGSIVTASQPRDLWVPVFDGENVLYVIQSAVRKAAESG